MLQYLLHRLTVPRCIPTTPAPSAPQAYLRADEATTGTPIALAIGLHVLIFYHTIDVSSLKGYNGS